MDPPADAPLPIAQLEPGLDAARTSVRGVVTLVWPYSASRRSFSVLLVEPDFRLRRNKGQVRVTFKRSCAKALARAGVASGDEVRLQLAGCKWLQEDSSSSLQTPGRSAGWELGFDREVHLEIRRPDAAVKTINIERTSSPEPLRPFTPPPPRTPVDHASPISPISVLSTTSTWSTPAFLQKKKRNLSSVLASSSSYDFLDDENTTAEQPAKKFKLGRGSRQWRVAARSPSPEQPEPSSSEPKRARFQLPDEPATQENSSNANESLAENVKPSSPAKAKPVQSTQESELQSSSDLFGPPLIPPKLREAPSQVNAPPPDQEPAEPGQTDQQDLQSSFPASRNDGSLQDSFESSGQVTPSFPPDDHPAAMMTFGSGFTEHSSPFSQRRPASQTRRRTEDIPLSIEDLGQTFLEGIMPITAAQDFARQPQNTISSHPDEQTEDQARATNGAQMQQEDYSSLAAAPTGDRGDRRDVISFDFAHNTPYNPPGGRPRQHQGNPVPVPVSIPPLGVNDTFAGLTSSPTSTQTPGLNNTFFNFESFGDGTDHLATITFDMSTIPGPQDMSDVPITPPEQSLLHYPHLSGVLRSPNVGGRPPSQSEVSQALAHQKMSAYQGQGGQEVQDGQDDQDDPTVSQDVESIVTEVIDSSPSESVAQNQDNPPPATTAISNAGTEEMLEEAHAVASPRKVSHSPPAAAPLERQQKQESTDDAPEQPAPVPRPEPEVIELSSGDESSDSEEEEELPAAPSRAEQDHFSESDGVEAAALSEDDDGNEESQETEVMSDEDVGMHYDQIDDVEDSEDSDDTNDDVDDSDDSNEPAEVTRHENEVQAANTALTVDDDDDDEDAKSDSTQVLEPEGERSESPTLTEDLELEAEVLDDDQVAASTAEHIELTDSKRIAEEDEKHVSEVPDVSVTMVESAPPVAAIEGMDVDEPEPEPEPVEFTVAGDEDGEREESVATTEEITTPDVAAAEDEAMSGSGESVDEPAEDAEESSITQRALEPEVSSGQVDGISDMVGVVDDGEALNSQSQISRHVDEMPRNEMPITSGLEKQQEEAEQQTTEPPSSPRKPRQTRSQKSKPQPQPQPEPEPEPQVRGSRRRGVASSHAALPATEHATEPAATEDPVGQETERAPRRVSKRKRAAAESEPTPAPSRITRQRRRKQLEPEPQPEETTNEQEETAMPEQQAPPAGTDSAAIATTEAAQPSEASRPARPTRRSTRKVSFQEPSQEAPATSSSTRPDPVSAQLFAELASEKPAEAPPLSSLPITQGVRTKNAYYTPLPNLHEHVNSQVDAACLIAGVSPAERAPSGPRDWHMTLYVTDAGLINTSLRANPASSSSSSSSFNTSPAASASPPPPPPSNSSNNSNSGTPNTLPSNGSYLRTVQIFRPNRSALPRAASPGDVLVLHNFRCQTRARRPMLLSTAQSGWVVFDGRGGGGGSSTPTTSSSSTSSAAAATTTTNPRSRQQRRQPAAPLPPRAKQTGPPIDYSGAEISLAADLRAWWASTVTAEQRDRVVAHAAAARDQARELARRRSGRKSRAAPGEVTHELRNGSRYPYTDSALLASDEAEAEGTE